MSGTTDAGSLSEAALDAALRRAVAVEGRQSGRLVFSAGMSDEEREIRLYDATWDEAEARRLIDGLVAGGGLTRGDADEYLQYLIQTAAWCRRVVENLDAAPAPRMPKAPPR